MASTKKNVKKGSRPTKDSRRVAVARDMFPPQPRLNTSPNKAAEGFDKVAATLDPNRKIRRLHGPLNGREALYALTGFLTTRDVPLTLSSNDTCANVAVIVDKFADLQGLPPMREEWGDLTVNVPEDHPLQTLTNEPHYCLGARPPKTAEQVLEAFYPDLLELNPAQQNALLARVIQRLRENRKAMREQLAHTVDDLQHRRGRLHEAEDELQNVLSGHFTIMQP